MRPERSFPDRASLVDTDEEVVDGHTVETEEQVDSGIRGRVVDLDDRSKVRDEGGAVIVDASILLSPDDLTVEPHVGQIVEIDGGGRYRITERPELRRRRRGEPVLWNLPARAL